MTNGEPDTYNIGDIPNLDSNLLLTQYSSEASQLIKSFTKTIPFVLIILAIIAAMTTFDLLMDLGFTRILHDETIDAVIIVVSILLIVFLIFTLRPVMRSQKILDKWSNLFENNAIRIGILLTINNKSKEEILNALSETIEQIDIPLHQYLSKSTNHNEIYNVSIDDTTFDILIDKSTINSNPTTTTTDASSLRDIIQDYGGILVKITDNTIDKDTTKTFIESLKKYRRKKGNKIGLAILVGENIELKSYELIDRVKDKNIRENLILIEKPDNPDLSLQALSNA